MRYIYQLKVWPKFTWNQQEISVVLGPIRHAQGRLIGRMEALGFPLRSEAVLQNMTMDILKSSEIEGENLDQKQVRSSIARHLGMKIGGLVPSDRHVDGVVEMILDATQNFDQSLTKSRLCSWQSSLFPGGRSGLMKITVGSWRKDLRGPMQVVSGPIGYEKVHFEAPAAERLNSEMKNFLAWFNGGQDIDPVLKAGLAHLWFVTIHPFEDGNGRIARAISDMQLARGDKSRERFYSMSVQIRQERKAYYDILEQTQKTKDFSDQGIDVTLWLRWFLECLGRSLEATEKTLSGVLAKARFWEMHSTSAMNERQHLMINRLFDGFEGKLTSSKWAKIAKCSQDTAHRDIIDLLDRGILVKDAAGGRSTSYSLRHR